MRGWWLLLAGCTSQVGVGATTSAPVGASGDRDLVMSAVSCWMGGLWSDALGEKPGDQREAGMVARCAPVIAAIGVADQRPMRAIDASIVARIDERIRDGHLRNLLDDAADATRESMHARLAADEVKADAGSHPPPATYADDKRAAADVLGQSQGLWSLLEAPPRRYGPYAAEARTLGLLVALDRMEIAFRLPKRLKLEVVGPAYAAVFGISAPIVHGDPAAPLPRGMWLGYLSAVASAAGHPVPSTLDIDSREALAWTGVEAGFADKLRAQPAYAESSRLGEAVRGVVHKLADGYDVQQKLVALKR